MITEICSLLGAYGGSPSHQTFPHPCTALGGKLPHSHHVPDEESVQRKVASPFTGRGGEAASLRSPKLHPGEPRQLSWQQGVHTVEGKAMRETWDPELSNC